MTMPAISPMNDDKRLLTDLVRQLDYERPRLEALDLYYEGRQPLRFLAPEVRQQVGDRLAPLVINWPRTIVDSVQRRCYVEGFRLGTEDVDADLWALWQASDMDEWSQLGQADALVQRRSFLLAWADDAGSPRLTVESAMQVGVDYAPGSRRVRSAVKVWEDGKERHAILFLPDRIVRYIGKSSSVQLVKETGKAQVTGSAGASWREVDVIGNPLGAVPVVPLVNNGRLLNLGGRSELADVIPLADAVNKLATDMMVTSEFHATKRRWATGIQIPNDPANKERLKAEVKQEWDQALKDKTWLAGTGVTFGQFDETQLANFTGAITMLTGQIAAIAGLPPHYLGVNGDNPASADAIRSAEATLNERAKEKHRAWGGSYERAMRMLVAIRDGVPLADIDAQYLSLETIWRDPETPTVAQSADAAVKLFQAGIIDDVQAQEDVGLSPAQREAIARRRDETAARAATEDVRARVDLARELQSTDGLTQNAALAAAGLLAAASANTTTP